MRIAAASAVCLTFLLSQVAAVALPFSNFDVAVQRRNNDKAICPRTTKEYEWCDAVSRCCMPGYGCNTCGEGNVGQSCVKRQKDGCKSDKDCYYSQKCIQNEHEPSFCAQLYVDTPPKHKPSKTSLLPAASSFAGSFANSASSFAMASSFMMPVPTGKPAPAPAPAPAPTPAPAAASVVPTSGALQTTGSVSAALLVAIGVVLAL